MEHHSVNQSIFRAGDLKQRSSIARTLFAVAMTVLVTACAIVTLIPLFAVLFYVGFQGIHRLDLAMFTQLPPAPGIENGGIGNAILGTLIVVGVASVFSVPFGVFAGIYLSEFGAGKLRYGIRLAANVLSGVPAILVGVFIYGLLVATGIFGFSAMAGSAALAVLMLPTITRSTDEALQLVPQEIRWAATAVGASSPQTVLSIILPAALPGIVTGVILAIARVAGEAAPLLFTALGSSLWFQGLLAPTSTLSVVIYNFAIAPFQEQQELAWTGSLILVLMVLITSVIARCICCRR
jgi:phosphate transport system permease protein